MREKAGPTVQDVNVQAEELELDPTGLQRERRAWSLGLSARRLRVVHGVGSGSPKRGRLEARSHPPPPPSSRRQRTGRALGQGTRGRAAWAPGSVPRAVGKATFFQVMT